MNRDKITRIIGRPRWRTSAQRRRLYRNLVIYSAHNQGCSNHLIAEALRLDVSTVRWVIAEIDRVFFPCKR
jgi:DNA-binding NarL/FixJ family response regulator